MTPERSLQTIPAQALINEPLSAGANVYARTVPEVSFISEQLRVLRKYRTMILAFTLVVVTLVGLATLKMTPMYRAESRMVINRESEDMLGFKDISTTSNSEDTWDYKIALETQVNVLQSDSLALTVIRQLDLARKPQFNPDMSKRKTAGPLAILGDSDSGEDANLIKAFHSNLKVTTLPRTRMVEVQYLSPDPKLAAQILNTLLHAFVEENFRARYDAAMQTSEWLSKQLVDLQRKVEVSQSKLVEYQKQHQIIGLDEKQNIITQKLDDLNKELTQAQADRMAKESQYQLTQSGNLELIPGIADNRVLERLKGQEAEFSAQLTEATTKFGSKYPKVVELSNQLNGTRQAINAEVERVAGRIRNEYKASVQRETLLRAALDRQKIEANQLNESAIEYNVLKRDFESNRQLYEDLQRKLKEAGVAAGLKSNNIRIVDVARPPARPAKPNVPLNLGLALFLGLAGGVATAFVLDQMNNTIRTGEDVLNYAGIPALASIPIKDDEFQRKALRKKATPLLTGARVAAPIVTIAQPKSQVAEAYRALRTSVLLSSSGAPPKVILVTSALPEEGKTTTSVNTAVVLAQKNSRVLLVDADLRRPRVHHYFQIPQSPGLTTLLTGGAPEDAPPVPSSIPNLFTLPSGMCPPYPAELLSSPAMKAALARWRNEFDHIVIDSPPSLSVTDAVLLSDQVDGLLLVARASQTSRAALRRATMLLRTVNARILGVVLNGVDLSSPDGYYYHYGYYYGKSHSYYEEERAAE